MDTLAILYKSRASQVTIWYYWFARQTIQGGYRWSSSKEYHGWWGLYSKACFPILTNAFPNRLRNERSIWSRLLQEAHLLMLKVRSPSHVAVMFYMTETSDGFPSPNTLSFYFNLYIQYVVLSA